MYARIENQTVVEFPITDIRKRFPGTSFPAFITEDSLPHGVVVVVPDAEPEYDATTHKLVRKTVPTLVSGSWVLGYDAAPFTAEELALRAAAVQQKFVAAIQQRLDDFARTRNYDGILSACTYATSTVPKFAAEGQYAVQARDATWAKAYEILGQVQSGTRPMPSSPEDIFPELPQLVWPA
jgi:hypothetical protein